MRGRLGGIFGDANVTLQHSRAVQALYSQLLGRDYSPRSAAAVALKERALGQLHVTPVRVTTPYQLLKGAFQLKGHEALWTDAACGLFVFDEIHAYEPERLALILGTIRHLTRDLGAKAFVMSATMPAWMRTIVAESLHRCCAIDASTETLAAFRRHQLFISQADLLQDETLARVALDFRAGRAVLVVATTVARAQEIHRRLIDDFGLPATVLHGRFHAEDRFNKERELLKQRSIKPLPATGPAGCDTGGRG